MNTKRKSKIVKAIPVKPDPQQSKEDLAVLKVRFLEAKVIAQATEIRELQRALAHALPGVWESLKRHFGGGDV